MDQRTGIPITDFLYDPATQQFLYRPTGQVWNPAGWMSSWTGLSMCAV
jgi:hypothetical protein